MNWLYLVPAFIVGIFLLYLALSWAVYWWRERRRLRKLETDPVVFNGQAADHCMAETIRSLNEYMASPAGRALHERAMMDDPENPKS